MNRLIFGVIVGALIGYPLSYFFQADMLKMVMPFKEYCTNVCSVLFDFSNRMNGANSIAYVTTGICSVAGSLISFLTIPQTPSVLVWIFSNGDRKKN